MSVTTMHDLGGCRVVLETVDEADELVAVLRDLPRARHRITRVYDYLHDDPGPKDSGYRGVHLACEYRASKPEYHGLRIGLQVRTQLQHAWATAVETMDLFSGSELKYGKGEPDVIRFFVLVSSLMAYEEVTAPSRAPRSRRRTCSRSWRSWRSASGWLGGCRGTRPSWATTRPATAATR
jgi:hypothetical protein